MYYVYVLQNITNNYIYVGYTSNIIKRFLQHNNGEVRSTKPYLPLRIVYYEAYLDYKDALDRERKLKHYGSVIGHLKNRLKNSFCSKGRG